MFADTNLKSIPIYDYVTSYWPFTAPEIVRVAHACVVPLLADKSPRKLEYLYLEIVSGNDDFDVSEFDPRIFTCGKDVFMLVLFKGDANQPRVMLSCHFLHGERRLLVLAFEKMSKECEDLITGLLEHIVKHASSHSEVMTEIKQLNLAAMEHKSDVQLLLPTFSSPLDKHFIWSCIAHHTVLNGFHLDSLTNLSPACVSVLPFKYMHVLSERVAAISNVEFSAYSSSLLGPDQKEMFSIWHARIRDKLDQSADLYNRQFERYLLRGQDNNNNEVKSKKFSAHIKPMDITNENKEEDDDDDKKPVSQQDKIGAQYMRIHLESSQGCVSSFLLLLSCFFFSHTRMACRGVCDDRPARRAVCRLFLESVEALG